MYIAFSICTVNEYATQNDSSASVFSIVVHPAEIAMFTVGTLHTNTVSLMHATIFLVFSVSDACYYLFGVQCL